MVRVAIVGAGPAGFFAAGELLEREDVEVDVFDRLPVPYGLVRHGVAPDHPAVKGVTGRYHRTAQEAGTRFRFFGNVEVGRDVSVEDLRQRYHAVILSQGAQASRRLELPGEQLQGVHPASSFVGWYNGHPDCADARFDLGAGRAVVIGMGNVALDLARVLLKPVGELARTDISDRALEALAECGVRVVELLARKGPASAACTPSELAELAQLPDTQLVVAPEDLVLDPDTERRRARGTLDVMAERKLETLSHAAPHPGPSGRTLRLRFWTSPEEFVGEDGRLTGVRVRRNRLAPGPDGRPRIEPFGPPETIPCGLAFESVGYQVRALPGIPLDPATGTVPHRQGQVLLEGAPVPGLFVCGWAKRGARGVIGSNKPDAAETVRTLLAAQTAGSLPDPAADGVEPLLASRQTPFVTYPGWLFLDALEVAAGQEAGRPRRKFLDSASMLQALAEGPGEPGSGTER